MGNAQGLALEPAGFQQPGAGGDTFGDEVFGLVGAGAGFADLRARAQWPHAKHSKAGEPDSPHQPQWPRLTHELNPHALTITHSKILTPPMTCPSITVPNPNVNF